MVEYLLFDCGAHSPKYRTYPFLDFLETIACERGHVEIGNMLDHYRSVPSLQLFKGDNGEIHYQRTTEEIAFERVVDEGDLVRVEEILKDPARSRSWRGFL